MILLPRFMLLLNHPDTITWNLAIFYLRSMFVVVLLTLPFVWRWINSNKKIFTCIRNMITNYSLNQSMSHILFLGLSVTYRTTIIKPPCKSHLKAAVLQKKMLCTLHNHLYRPRVSVETLTKWNHAIRWRRTSSSV